MPLLDIVLGHDCNLACTYCTITREMRAEELPGSAVGRYIDHAAKLGYRDVAFTGGEPTIRKELPAFVKYAKKRNFENVKIASNGLRYADPAYLDMLVVAGVNQFHMSMHAIDDDAYEKTVRLEGTAVLRRRAIANLVARNLDPIADLILKEDTYRDVQRWVLLLADQGIRQFRLWLVSLTDGNAPNTQQLPRISDVAEAVKEACAAGRERNLDVRSLHIPRCFLRGFENHVFHPGAEKVMVVSPGGAFELSDSLLSGGVKPLECKRCKYVGVCPGLRKDYAALHGDQEPRAVVGDLF